MPIHLTPPAHRPKGPDGQGWNRIALGSLAGDECALRPRDYPTLVDSQDTRRARYGGYGPCIGRGDCKNCPILQRLREKPKRLEAFGDRVLVRIDDRGVPHLMNHEEKGWDSWAVRWSWEDLARLTGWAIGDRHQDEHSDGFWLVRDASTPTP